MNYTLKLALVLNLLLLSSFTFSQNKNHINNGKFQRVDSLFQSYFQENETGASFTIIKNEKTVYNNQIGLANLEYQRAITDTTVFNIASISKQFTSFLALLLEQEGKLSLHDDIRIHLPELRQLPKKITIKQLMNHTHGLPNPDELAQLKGVHTMTHQEVLAMLLRIDQTNFEAGATYEYNNTGYILLSEIIARVGKQPFKEQLQEKIFKPLHMNHTQAIGDKNTVVLNKAYSYRFENGNYVNFPIRLATMGSSGINTTSNDLSIWAKHYQNTKIGHPEFFQKMQTATLLTSGGKVNYGLGLEFDNYKGVDIVFHGGGTESYRSYILHAPKHQLSLIFLSNAGGFSGLDVIYKSLEILLKDVIKKPKPYQASASASAKNLKQYAGVYEMFPGTYFDITSEDGNLFFQDFGATEKILLPRIAKNVFEVPFIPHSKFVFSTGKFDFQIADFNYPCKKVQIALPTSKEIDLNAYVGTYKNLAHNTSYELVIANSKLTAIHPNINYAITLHSLAKDSFYTKEPFFGKLDFVLNKNQEVIGFKLSGQNLKQINFKKIN